MRILTLLTVKLCRSPMKPSFLASFTFAAVACLAVHAKAAKKPLALNELQKSDLIVVGTIRQIRIESEPSYGLGNYDWGIYVTLAVEKVEKGELTDTEIEFRCFRIKQRRSLSGYIAPSGHRPIPGTGTTIRAYLKGGKPTWFAALPNGITASDANDDASVRFDPRLTDAAEIGGLRSRRYTYFLPLELWGFMFVVVSLTILAINHFCAPFTILCCSKFFHTSSQKSYPFLKSIGNIIYPNWHLTNIYGKCVTLNSPT